MENGNTGNDNANNSSGNVNVENNENALQQKGNEPKPGEECIIKMRGLPWSATVEDITKFFSDCAIKNGKDGIHLTMSSLGRPSGEAYVELQSADDTNKALKRDRQHMGHRYIEVFPTTLSEMQWVVSRCGMNVDTVMEEGCIRMRGLPYGCTTDEVVQFFSGLTIVPNGINFATDYTGRATGEAYVQFANKENVEKALKKHMERIGHRYIEIFRSSIAEVSTQASGPKMRSSFSSYGRSAPYDRGDRFGGNNRSGGGSGGGPVSRGGGGGSGSRFRNDNDWDDYRGGDNNYWGGNDSNGPTPLMKTPARGGNSYSNDYVDGPRHLIHMRGLPYRAIEDDIAMFFKPLRPVDIRIVYDKTDRPSGEAIVEFSSHEEAVEAMSKDKEHIQSRYIELFLDSSPEYNNRSGGGGGNNSGGFRGATNRSRGTFTGGRGGRGGGFNSGRGQ